MELCHGNNNMLCHTAAVRIRVCFRFWPTCMLQFDLSLITVICRVIKIKRDVVVLRLKYCGCVWGNGNFLLLENIFICELRGQVLSGEIWITGNTSAAGIMFYSPSPRPPRSWGHEGRCKSARHVPHNNNRFWRRRNTTILHSYKNHVGWNMIFQWKESDRTEVTKKVARVRMLLMNRDGDIGTLL